MAENEVEIGLLLLLSRRNRRRLLMQRQTQKKTEKGLNKRHFKKGKTQCDYNLVQELKLGDHSVIQPPLLHHSKPTFSRSCLCF